MSADEFQARTDAFASVYVGRRELPRRATGQITRGLHVQDRKVSEEADEAVFWLTRMKNNGIRSSAVGIKPLLKETDELAAKRRRRRPDGQ